VASEAVDFDKQLRVFGSFKSAREDGIYPALLKNGIEILSGLDHTGKIFTACLVLGYRRRGKGCGLFLFQNQGEIKSFLLKTMERLVDQSIRMDPLKRYPLECSYLLTYVALQPIPG
jgi:hypothetical protein